MDGPVDNLMDNIPVASGVGIACFVLAMAKLHVMQGTLYKKIGEKKLAYQAYQRAFALDKDNVRLQEAMDKLQAETGEVN